MNSQFERTPSSLVVLPQLFHPFGYPVCDDERLVAVLHAVRVFQGGAVQRGVERVFRHAKPELVLGTHDSGHSLGCRQQLLSGVDVVHQAYAIGVLGRDPLPCHAHLRRASPADQLWKEERGGEVGATRSYVDILGARKAVETSLLLTSNSTTIIPASQESTKHLIYPIV